jgi:GNAT superfamily N-acetyltransferase
MELRPLAEGDAAELRRIRATPEVERWWDAVEDDFPWSDDPESTRFTIVVDGAVAGLIQYSEELEPKYRHASIDLFLDPALHGRGIGTAATTGSRSIRPSTTPRRSAPTRRRASGRSASCGPQSATPTARAGTTPC